MLLISPGPVYLAFDVGEVLVDWLVQGIHHLFDLKHVDIAAFVFLVDLIHVVMFEEDHAALNLSVFFSDAIGDVLF